MTSRCPIKRTFQSLSSSSSRADLTTEESKASARHYHANQIRLALLVCEDDNIAFPVVESTLYDNSKVMREMIVKMPKNKPYRISMGKTPAHAVKRMLSFLAKREYNDAEEPDVPSEVIRSKHKGSRGQSVRTTKGEEKRASMLALHGTKTQAKVPDVVLLFNNIDVYFLALQYALPSLAEVAIKRFRRRLQEADKGFWTTTATVAAVICAIYSNADHDTLHERRDVRQALAEEIVNHHISSPNLLLPGVEEELRDHSEFAIDYAYVQQQCLKREMQSMKALHDQLRKERANRLEMRRTRDEIKAQLATTRLALATEKHNNEALRDSGRALEQSLMEARVDDD